MAPATVLASRDLAPEVVELCFWREFMNVRLFFRLKFFKNIPATKVI